MYFLIVMFKYIIEIEVINAPKQYWAHASLLCEPASLFMWSSENILKHKIALGKKKYFVKVILNLVYYFVSDAASMSVSAKMIRGSLTTLHFSTVKINKCSVENHFTLY